MIEETEPFSWQDSDLLLFGGGRFHWSRRLRWRRNLHSGIHRLPKSLASGKLGDGLGRNAQGESVLRIPAGSGLSLDCLERPEAHEGHLLSLFKGILNRHQKTLNDRMNIFLWNFWRLGHFFDQFCFCHRNSLDTGQVVHWHGDRNHGLLEDGSHCKTRHSLPGILCLFSQNLQPSLMDRSSRPSLALRTEDERLHRRNGFRLRSPRIRKIQFPPEPFPITIISISHTP